MKSTDRFKATVSREPVDRPCTWLGIPHPAAIENLLRHFKAATLSELTERLDDDIVPVEIPYHSPTSDAIYTAFNFAGKEAMSRDDRTLTAPGFFANRTDPSDVGLFDWPDPARYISPERCRQGVAEVSPGRVRLGVIWSAHFQDACAAFGMEHALAALHSAPGMFRAVIDRVVEFCGPTRFSRAARAPCAVLIGNDFGGRGPSVREMIGNSS